MEGKKAELKNYELKGEFLEKGAKRKFSKVVSAQNEKYAKEKVFALLGSKHRIRRRFVNFESVGEYKEGK